MSRVCIFCSREGQKLTLEHAYPHWLSGLFSKPLKATNEVSGGNVNRVWQGRVFQHKVKLVCGDCNNGWMSALEGEAKPLLTSLVLTHDGRTFSREDQRIISLWAQKTVLVINKAVGGDFDDIPKIFYEQLYADTQPITNIMVSMGWRMLANGSKDQPLASFEIKQVTSVEAEKSSADALRKQMDDDALIWTAILALGNIVFHVVGTNISGHVEVGSSDHRMFFQINPYQEDLPWPLEWPIEAVGGLEAVRKGM